MNTTQVEKALLKDKYVKKHYCGVIPLDFLPKKKLKTSCYFIVNTHKSYQPGEHWLSIYIPKKGPIEYFDSYGLKPSNKEILNFLKRNRNHYIYNNVKIQGINSLNCGKFSIFFIYFRSRNFKMKDYLKFFSTNKTDNDLFITKLYEKIIK